VASIIKFGQFVRHYRLEKGMTQKELSMKVFEKPNVEYIGDWNVVLQVKLPSLQQIKFCSLWIVKWSLNCIKRISLIISLENLA